LRIRGDHVEFPPLKSKKRPQRDFRRDALSNQTAFNLQLNATIIFSQMRQENSDTAGITQAQEKSAPLNTAKMRHPARNKFCDLGRQV
jgi:hypothetical protein